MKKLATCLTIVAALAMVGSASAAITVDGVISTGEWDGFTYSDPVGDGASSDILNWGARVEGDYLYWFAEISPVWTTFQGYSGTKEKKVFPGLWVDVDNSAATYVTDGGANPGDDKGLGWQINHRGMDVNMELGLGGDWVNGSNTQTWAEGPGSPPSCYNFWGLNDDVGDVVAAVSDGSWYINGSVLEARIKVSEFVNVAENLMTDGTTCKTTAWKVGLASQGTDRSAYQYGYDVTLPRPIGISGDYIYGDTDLDGTVGLSDLNTLKGNWQATLAATDLGWALGDFDGDLSVGLSDLNALKAAWQQSYTGGGAVTPEPATLGLLVLGVLGLLRRR